MFRLVGIAVLLVPMLSWADDAPMTYDEALKVIRKAKTVDAGGVGFGGVKTKTYDAFEVVRKKASWEQLLTLTDDTNANIRAYAAWGIKLRYPKRGHFELMMRKLKDEATVNVYVGCLQMKTTIGDHYYETFGKKLNAKQRLAVTKLLLTTDNELSLTGRVLQSWEIPPEFYLVVRNKAVNGNAAALIALAKFRKKEDVQIIIKAAEKHPFYAYRCIAMNPLPEYFGLLQKHHPALLADKHWSTDQREFYLAVAAYGNKKAVEILTKPLDGTDKTIPMREYHLEFVNEAVAGKNDAVFDPFKWRLWSEENIISERVYERLVSLDEKRATSLTRKSLAKLNWEVSDDFKTAMFAQMAKTDPDFVETIIIAGLKRADISDYEFYANIASEKKKDSYVAPLFKALETADNPHVYLAAAKALLCYKKKEMNQKIIAAPTKNPCLTEGWGGEVFEKLLQKELNQPPK